MQFPQSYILLLAGFFLFSCDNSTLPEPSPINPEEGITCTPDSLFFAAEREGPQTIQVSASSPWLVSDRGNILNWFTYAVDGNKIKVTVTSENIYPFERTGSLMIKSTQNASDYFTVTVVQRGQGDANTLNVSADALYFFSNGGKASVTVTTNRDQWEAQPQTRVAWYAMTQQDDQLTLTIEPNSNSASRVARIDISTGDVYVTSHTLTLRQSGAGIATLSLSANSLEFDSPQGKTSSISVTSNQARVTASSSASWCDAVVSGGKLALSVSENTSGKRVAEVKVTAGDPLNTLSRTVTVTQYARRLGDYKNGGVVFWISGSSYKIVDVDVARTQWSRTKSVTGATSKTNGQANQRKVGSGYDYPAFRACPSGWYLPAADELKEFFKAYGQNTSRFRDQIQANGGDTFSPYNAHWSSTEASAAEAYSVRQGSLNQGTKTDYNYVRCVKSY